MSIEWMSSGTPRTSKTETPESSIENPESERLERGPLPEIPSIIGV